MFHHKTRSTPARGKVSSLQQPQAAYKLPTPNVVAFTGIYALRISPHNHTKMKRTQQSSFSAHAHYAASRSGTMSPIECCFSSPEGCIFQILRALNRSFICWISPKRNFPEPAQKNTSAALSGNRFQFNEKRIRLERGEIESAGQGRPLGSDGTNMEFALIKPSILPILESQSTTELGAQMTMRFLRRVKCGIFCYAIFLHR